jgi:hypothetical protein
MPIPGPNKIAAHKAYRLLQASKRIKPVSEEWGRLVSERFAELEVLREDFEADQTRLFKDLNNDLKALEERG